MDHAVDGQRLGFPGGPVSNSAIALGAVHPDNPYFGTAARLRYLAFDVGPQVKHGESDFYRFLAGIKGTVADWDYDSAVLYSETKVSDMRTGYPDRSATSSIGTLRSTR